MRVNFTLAMGLVIINAAILWYERPAGFTGWRIYVTLAAILLISAVSPVIGVAILAPVTALNVLFNTTRIFQLERRN